MWKRYSWGYVLWHVRCIVCFGFCLWGSPKHEEGLSEDVMDASLIVLHCSQHTAGVFFFTAGENVSVCYIKSRWGDECVQMGKKYRSWRGGRGRDWRWHRGCVCHNTPASLMLTCQTRQQCGPQPIFLFKVFPSCLSAYSLSLSLFVHSQNMVMEESVRPERRGPKKERVGRHAGSEAGLPPASLACNHWNGKVGGFVERSGSQASRCSLCLRPPVFVNFSISIQKN